MPQVQNVTVHVTDEDGKDLEEWGVRNLRGNHASAYIRSTTDMPFKVSIRPKIPYIDVQQQLQGRRPHDKRNKRQDGAHIKEASNDDDMNEIPSCSEPKGHGKQLSAARLVISHRTIKLTRRQVATALIIVGDGPRRVMKTNAIACDSATATNTQHPRPSTNTKLYVGFLPRLSPC